MWSIMPTLFLSLSLLTVAAAQVTVPAGCESVATSLVWDTFTWFNSSHNLDCDNPNFPPDAEYCVNNTSSDPYNATEVLCDPTVGPCTACYGMCTQPWVTGITDQPLGYGPPDVVDFGDLCTYQNPVFLNRYEVGEGPTGCGVSSEVVIEFWGDSNVDEGNNASFWYSPEVLCGSADGGYYRYVYEATFPLHCARDADNNATCTTNLPLEIPLTSFTG